MTGVQTCALPISIMQKLDKIEAKLDTFDSDIENRIKEALEHHVKEYHHIDR